MGKKQKSFGYNISIVASTGKRKRLEEWGLQKALSQKKKPLVTFRTKRDARAMIKTLHPNTIDVYKPRIIRAKK